MSGCRSASRTMTARGVKAGDGGPRDALKTSNGRFPAVDRSRLPRRCLFRQRPHVVSGSRRRKPSACGRGDRRPSRKLLPPPGRPRSLRSEEGRRPSSIRVVHCPHLFRLRGQGSSESLTTTGRSDGDEPTSSCEILIPTEDVVEIKDGKKVRSTQASSSLATCWSTCVMSDDAWHVVKNTPKVTGFVGTGNKPVPLSASREVERIVNQVTVAADQAEAQARVQRSGSQVRIVDGPFSNFTGNVEEVNEDRSTLEGDGHDLRSGDPGRTGIPAGGAAVTGPGIVREVSTD